MTSKTSIGAGGAARTALTAVIAIAASGAAASQTERNREAVRDAFEIWADGGDVFGELLAEDVVWTIPGSGSIAGTYSGRRAVVDEAAAPLVSRLATPIVPDLRRICAEGDTVVVRFDGAATTTSGNAYRNQFLWILRMEDGRVVEAEAFLDLDAYREVVRNNEPRVAD